MQVNSINSNTKHQSFNGLYLHNKAVIDKRFGKSINKILELPHVKDVVNSKNFDLHIKPGKLELKYCIKAVNQGIKGIWRNIKSKWEPIHGEYLGRSNISNYKTIYHPTPEIKALFKAREQELKNKKI